MAARTSHTVLTAPDSQPASIQPLEWWTDRNGRKWQRATLGDVAAGSLILGAMKASGLELLWRGRHTPRAIISEALEATLEDAWARMVRKPGPHQLHRVYGRSDDIAVWWLASLPLTPLAASDLLPYIVEPRLYGGGSELFRILPPAIRRPRMANEIV